MAMSLLYALLDVHDMEKLNDIKEEHQQYEQLTEAERMFKHKDLTPEQRMQAAEKFDNQKRALKYYKLQPKQKKEVKQALYTALYHIVEYPYINPDVNMAIGKALCNAMSENPQENLKDHPGILGLRKVLNPILTEAIDEIETSSPKLAS